MLQMLEDQLDESPTVVSDLLPGLYSLFGVADAELRTSRVREKTLRALMRMQAYGPALRLLQEMPNTELKLVAECHEGLGEMETAAAEYLRAGNPQDALRCYRKIPDFDKMLELVDTLGDHPARESLLWLRRMRDLAAERPAEFTKVVLPTEKKFLEHILETSLGASRKKLAARKTAAKKAPRGAFEETVSCRPAPGRCRARERPVCPRVFTCRAARRACAWRRLP